MAPNPPDERTVYLSLKNVFKGGDANLLKLKSIKKRILDCKEEPEIRALIDEHNIDHVSTAAKSLLAKKIFASTLEAKTRFPEVFEVSPAQSLERESYEAEAAGSEVETFNDIDAAEGDQETVLPARRNEFHLARIGKARALGKNTKTTLKPLLTQIRE